MWNSEIVTKILVSTHAWTVSYGGYAQGFVPAKIVSAGDFILKKNVAKRTSVWKFQFVEAEYKGLVSRIYC